MNTNIKKEYSINFKSNRQINKEKLNFWFKNIYIFMLLLISALFIYYIWNININATKWYNIIELKNDRATLLKNKELLDIKLSEIESLDSIRTSKNIDTLDMETVEEHSYIIINEDT